MQQCHKFYITASTALSVCINITPLISVHGTINITKRMISLLSQGWISTDINVNQKILVLVIFFP